MEWSTLPRATWLATRPPATTAPRRCDHATVVVGAEAAAQGLLDPVVRAAHSPGLSGAKGGADPSTTARKSQPVTAPDDAIVGAASTATGVLVEVASVPTLTVAGASTAVDGPT